MQGLVVLHEDVQIIPLTEIPQHVRGQLGGEDGDFALTRPYSRNPSKVIDANAASLLRQFRSPRTIVEGILAYSREAKVPASAVLDEAYPLIESCLRSSLLVEPGAAAEKIQPSFGPGDSIDGNIVERAIQALVDSEVYQVRTPSGQLAALKIATPNVVRAMEKALAKEAAILRHLDGAPAPALLGLKMAEDARPWLLTEWLDGDDGQTKAQKIKAGGRTTALASICANILDAYATLHERGVIHGDIHPRNILISESGEVRIIDFGISHMADGPAPAPPRSGVAFFFEPEYAQALRAAQPLPAQTLRGEQFSVAALVYFLLCGAYYTDFSFDKDTLLRQVAEDRPLPFERRGLVFPAALEAAVMRALDKNPNRRFGTTRQFAAAFRAALARTPFSGVHAASESKILLDRVLEIIGEPDRALTYEGPASPAASVTYGQAGIALAALHIAAVRDDVRLLGLADAWAERAAVARTNPFYSASIQITPETVGHVSPWHTESGIAAVQALLATARGDKLNLDSAVNRYLLQTSAQCDNPDLTLGNAAVLLGLMLLLEANGDARPAQLMERGRELNALLLDEIRDDNTVSYLGIAHGRAGLLYAALRWSKVTGTKPPEFIEQHLRRLAGYARFTIKGARWPVQDGPGSVTMAGWCNGSAGYTFLWTLAHHFYKDSLWLELAQQSATDAFEGSGGGHALCCGFAGQAYAQLNVYNHTGDRFWLRQARTLAEKAAAAGNLLASRRAEALPHSLYKGDIGVAVLIAELEKPETAAMPFFESPR